MMQQNTAMISKDSSSGWADRLIVRLWPTPPHSLAERTRRRVSLHLLPFLFLLYVLAYLDRVNVSVAQFDLMKPIEEGGMGFRSDVYGFGAGVFFWGYWILEIPSTLSIERWGARWVFVRILVLWGLCAALVGAIGTPLAARVFGWLPTLPEQAGWATSLDHGFDWLAGGAMSLFGRQNPLDPAAHLCKLFNGLSTQPAYQFYVLRFMLGFFEGGFFPSVIVYLSMWFRSEDRAKAIAGFMSAIPLSSALGVPISGFLLGIHWFGIPGWRWIFILEGIAPVLAGIATIFLLPDRPSVAPWLPEDERSWLLSELEKEQRAKEGRSHWAWLNHLGGVLLLTIVYFCMNVTSYGLSMFMPKIIKSQTALSDMGSSLLASLPYAIAFMAMYVNGWHSDRKGERPWHAAVPMACLGSSLFLVALLDGHGIWPVLILILCVGASMYAHLPAFWPIPTMFLGSTAAASAIGFINMIGNLGGGVGPMIVGNQSVGKVGFAGALYRIAPWSLAAAAVVLLMSYTHRRKTTVAQANK
jgi:sugar phosphate permease